MIKIASLFTNEASRVWGDFIEKQAFDVNVDPANVLGSLAGGYAATRTYQSIQDKEEKKRQSAQSIENNHYDTISNILADLKITFTPINVVYSVNGQVFEIIKTTEMTQEMKERFLSKDSVYYKQILINKMNMELQLAEQVFARKMLESSGQLKQSSHYYPAQYALTKLSEETFQRAHTQMLEKFSSQAIPLSPSFDSLRPFERNADFFHNAFSKIAGPADYFSNEQSESLNAKDLKAQVKIGFLPDRVLFLHNGQLLEQISVLHMNEEGFEAFKAKDKEFFFNFFLKETNNIAAQTFEEVAAPQFNSIDEPPAESHDKQAASLEEVIEDIESGWIEKLAPERGNVSVFTDDDIHPIVYESILDEKYGVNWHRNELQALLKQIEVDYSLTEGLGDRALDKIAMLQAIHDSNNSVFQTPFTFEKFLRAMNDKTIAIDEFEGNLEFEEILFGLEIAESICGEDVYMEFHETLAAYISEELFQDNIRFVSDQMYDETNEWEKAFWESVNSFLSRKWKDRGTHGMMDDEQIASIRFVFEQIKKIGEDVLGSRIEFLNITRPYDSIESLINEEKLVSGLPAEYQTGVKEAIIHTAGRHLIASLFKEIKRLEVTQTLELWNKEVGGNE